MTVADAELLAQLTNAIAEAKAAAANANAAAANASQASSGAAAGVAGARSQSNVESALDRAMSTVQQLQQTQVESDIDTPEAWKANVKRTYDMHQTYDMESMQHTRTLWESMISEQIKHLAALNQLTIQAVTNNQNQSNLNNTLSIDRSWNVNETDLAAKSTAVLTDAVLSEIARRVKTTPAT